jgi:hypothetical protein
MGNIPTKSTEGGNLPDRRTFAKSLFTAKTEGKTATFTTTIAPARSMTAGFTFESTIPMDGTNTTTAKPAWNNWGKYEPND